MNCTFMALGLVCIAFGLFSLFNRNFMWQITEWSNSMKGVKSERTDAWEHSNGCTAGVSIILGLGFVLASFLSPS